MTAKIVPEASWLDPVHTRHVYYAYDNRGLQTAARFDSLAGEGVTDALVAEYDSAGTMIRRYIHGGDKGADDPLVWYDNVTAGWRRALHAGQQGSIVAVADMSGNAWGINTYDEYGIPGANNTGRFQYTGQAWIPELGMYDYKARIYSPTLGRFLQVTARASSIDASRVRPETRIVVAPQLRRRSKLDSISDISCAEPRLTPCGRLCWKSARFLRG